MIGESGSTVIKRRNKVKERITSETFPCKHRLDARRKPHGCLWSIQEFRIYDHGDEAEVDRIQILKSSIPGTIRFLQELYDNTPGDDK